LHWPIFPLIRFSYILSWDKFWIPFTVVSLSIYLLIFFLAKDVKKNPTVALILIFICASYGASAVISLNSILDKSLPSVYKAKIIEKRISNGRSTSYYLNLSPWGSRTEEKDVDVKKSLFDRAKIGDSVHIYVRNGSLGIPWFDLQSMHIPSNPGQ
jgi:hypothetical protein